MWVFSKEGFFSIVKKDCEADQLLVRARIRGDLENILRPIVKAGYGPFTVVEVPHADYRYRVVLPAWMVGDYLGAAVDAIDYDNFKNSLPTNENRRERSAAYMEVWAAMRHWQERIINGFRHF
jgi:hypothetical protein